MLILLNILGDYVILIRIIMGENKMKEKHLLIWLTQLGLSVVTPLVGFPLGAVWLKNSFGWGSWVIWVAVGIGIICAVDGFRASLQILNKLSKSKKEPPSISFNEHQ